MMLTTKTRYAVMAILDMAIHSQQGHPVRLSNIATRQDIDLRYLEQIYTKLRKANIVQSVRGPGGGYLLSKTPEAITIYDIVMAVEENIEQTRCQQSGIGCIQPHEKCISHHLWSGLTVEIKKYLSQMTISSVVASKRGVM